MDIEGQIIKKEVLETAMNIYVNIKSAIDGDGSFAKPFRNIDQAAAIAKPGDTVLVAPGVYREKVDPINSGTEYKRISYISTEPLAAVITGSERISSGVPLAMILP